MTGDENLLRIETVSLEGVDVLRMCGEIDTSNAHDLEQALLALRNLRGVVDLTKVDYIDSAGVRALDRGLSALVGRGGAFRAVAPSGSPARLTLRVTGYAESMVSEDVAAAVAALTS